MSRELWGQRQLVGLKQRPSDIDESVADATGAAAGEALHVGAELDEAAGQAEVARGEGEWASSLGGATRVRSAGGRAERSLPRDGAEAVALPRSSPERRAPNSAPELSADTKAPLAARHMTTAQLRQVMSSSK